MPLEVILSSEAKTQELAQKIAMCLESGDVLLLNGPLGAGKTTFVKELAKSLGVDEAEVVSPTFVIAQKYQGRELGIHHLDLYRIDDMAELDPLLRELPDSESILVVEWGSKLDPHTFSEHLTINFEYGSSDNQRLATLIFTGTSWGKAESLGQI